MKNLFTLRHIVATAAVAAAVPALQAQTFEGQSFDQDGWKTVWFDQFEGNALDASKWNIETSIRNGGNNGELQYYGPEGISVKDGKLIITASRTARSGCDFTSGRINSKDKVYFTHGKIEARIKLPKTYKGLWPAFWMMGNTNKTWPRNGEIDIFEMGHADGWKTGNNPETYLNGALHWGYYENGWYPNTAHADNAWESVQDGQFHIFTCEWNEQYIDMSVDGQSYFAYDFSDSDYPGEKASNKYFHKPFYLLFNLAVGGKFPFPGNGDYAGADNTPANVTAIPAGGAVTMEVDWVRVAQPEGNDAYTFMQDYVEPVTPEDNTPDLNTETGNWCTPALDKDGQMTFDRESVTDIVPVMTSGWVASMFQEMCANDETKTYHDGYAIDEVTNFLYLWDGGHYAGDVKSGLNSFGLEEGYSTYSSTGGWTGAGCASPAGKGKDMTLLDGDDWILHFSLKGDDKAMHTSQDITVGNVKFRIGDAAVDGSIARLGDYPRDGQWYSFDIPLKVLRALNPTKPLFADASNPANNYAGNVFAFSSGDKYGATINPDNVFFYRTTNPDVMIGMPVDTETELSRYASPAIDDEGLPTFDFENATDYIPVMISGYTGANMDSKVAQDLTLGNKTVLYNWENTYDMSQDATGTNSMTDDGSYSRFFVGSMGWSGFGIHFLDATAAQTDNQFLDDEEYWLHFALKGDDAIRHAAHQFTIGDAKFKVGPAAYKIDNSDATVTSIGDFPRDNKWYNFDIPLSHIKAYGQMRKTDVLMSISSGVAEGAGINLDNIFFYKNAKKAVATADATPMGKYISKAVEGGKSTFKPEYCEDVIPFIVSGNTTDGVRSIVNDKIREGFEDFYTNFYPWENTFGEGPGCEENSFGFPESCMSLKLANSGWNGGAFNIGNAVDFSFIESEDYTLHMGIRDANANTHAVHSTFYFTFNDVPFTLGDGATGVVTDFPRDGQWYYLDLPLKELGNVRFKDATAYNGNVLYFNVKAPVGTLLDMDNVFLYRNTDTSGVEEIAAEGAAADIQVSAYPNPTSTYWQVRANSAQGNVALYSLDGKYCGNTRLADGQAQVDATTLGSGLYLLKVDTPAGSKTLRVIKR